MKRKIVNENAEKLDEFTSSDGQGVTADPIAKDSGRPADKSGGETAIPDFPTKIEAIHAVVDALSGLSKGQIGDIFKGLTAGLDHSKSKRPRDKENGETPESTHRSPTSAGGHAISAAEDIQDIFGGDDLSEDIKQKATVVFEAAVNARLAVEQVRLEEENELYLEETIESLRTELVESVDKYLSYAVDEWVKQNQIAIESSLKSEIVDEFIGGLKSLFAEHYIDVPEDKVDVIEQLTSRIEELEAKLNETIEQNVDLSAAVVDAEVQNVFADMTEGLVMTQVEKLKGLSEGIEYSSVEEFKKKFSIIKETYFPSEKKPATSSTVETLNESVDDVVETVKPTGVMGRYVDSLSRLSKK